LLLAGNSSPAIPHQFSQHKRSGFQVGSCDNAAAYGHCQCFFFIKVHLYILVHAILPDPVEVYRISD
jgi:hypothetical protein